MRYESQVVCDIGGMGMFSIAVAIAIVSWGAGILGTLSFTGRGGTKCSIAGIALAFVVGFLLSRILQMTP